MLFLPINAVDAVAISLFIYLLVTFRDSRRGRGLSYPPGPPSWHRYVQEIWWRNNICTTGSPQLNRASRSDIVYLRAFSKVIVVLSSFSAIKDLLEKRGNNYSDRPSNRGNVRLVAFYFPMGYHVDNL